MDRFLFRYADYSVLNPVKEVSFDRVPVPFQACLFIIQDTALRIESRVISDCLLTLKFFRTDREWPIGEAKIALVEYRWSKDASISFVGSVPPDCLYDFIQFYQRLSIYLFQEREIVNISPKEIIQAEKLEHRIDAAKKNDPKLEERIISLRDLSTRTVYQYVVQFLDHSTEGADQHNHQTNPCSYAYWVRGHVRVYKTGTNAWVRPHMRNTKYPERAKIYKL